MTRCPACQRTFAPPSGVPWICPHCRCKVLGRYRNLDWIGGGAMGDVYRAVQPDMGNRVVAIKIPKTLEPMYRSRFEREIVASARLEHPNIVRAYDRNEHSGWSYLVMEYVRGELLADLVQREHPLHAGRVARLLAGVARGLAHAAQRGVINRDIKPENIQVGVAEDTAKILDYGLARIVDLDGNSRGVTHSGTLLGTPSYMAPEQARDPHGVTIAADVYSLGCTLFYSLVGRAPFLGVNSAAVCQEHATAPRPRVRSFRSDVPADLDDLLARMMAIKPAHRPHPDEVADQLDALAARLGPEPAPSAGRLDRMIDIICPSCGETYHVQAGMVGTTMQCPNVFCRRCFTIRPAQLGQIGNVDEPPPVRCVPQVEMHTESCLGSSADADQLAQAGTNTSGHIGQCKQMGEADAGSPLNEPGRPWGAGEYGFSAGEDAQIVRVAPSECNARDEDIPLAEPVGDGPHAGAATGAATGIERLDALPVSPLPPGGDAARDAAPAGTATSRPLEPPAGNGGHEPPVLPAMAGDVEPPPVQLAQAVPVADPLLEAGAPSSGFGVGGDQVTGGQAIEVVPAVAVDRPRSPSSAGSNPAWMPPIAMATAVPLSSGDVPHRSGATMGAPPLPGGGGALGASGGLFGAIPIPITTRKTARTRRGPNLSRSQRIVRGVVAAVSAAVLLLAVVVGYQQYIEYTKTPDQRWADCKKLYDDQSWTLARKEFLRFKKDYSDHPNSAQVSFFVDMCDAQSESQSLTGDPVRGLELCKEVFTKHRDNPAYNDYCADLYQGLERLVDAFNGRALARVGVRGTQQENKSALVVRFFRRTWNSEDLPAARRDIRRAREAHELLATVGRARTEDWVLQRTEELRRSIASAAVVIDLAGACKEAVELLQPVEYDFSVRRFDDVYARLDVLGQRHPELLASSELAELRERFEALEPKRVRRADLAETGHAPAMPANAVARGGSGDSRSLAVAWQDAQRRVTAHANPAIARPVQGKVVLALAQGVLYAFSERGEFLWARRLGIDSYRLPQRFEASLIAPAMLVAISTDDNSLVAIEEATGRLLWRFPAGGDLAAPPTVVHLFDGPNDKVGRVRGLMPTATGEIRCLELVLGRELCHFQVGEPITVAGTFNQDGKNPLVYFAAASKRVYAIDPRAIDDETRDPCVCVLYTGHAHGAVRSPPVVLDRYLVLPEARTLDEMVLTCYLLDRQGRLPLRAVPRKQEQILGWSWFAPDLWPDRMLLVSDAGDVGLFGFNLDNPREAVFRLIEPQRVEVPDASATGTRALAVYQDEHAVWAMIGGRLRKLAVNVLEGKLQEIWPRNRPAAVEGIPLHEA